MYLVILDVDSIIHFIDHKGKYDCVTICGLHINPDKNNILALDNEVSNCCTKCKYYFNLIYGSPKDKFSRNVNQQNLLLKSTYLDISMKDTLKYKALSNRYWSSLIKYKQLLKRKTFQK